jgi:hypothetical protein
VLEKLAKQFRLDFCEQFLGVQIFKSDEMQANAILNEDGQISEIAVHTSLEGASQRAQAALASDDVDVLCPVGDGLAA